MLFAVLGQTARIGGIMPSQGIGVRVPGKDDHRHMLGLGRFVGDIRMAGLSEVAFLRSPLAHGRLRAVENNRTEASFSPFRPVKP